MKKLRSFILTLLVVIILTACSAGNPTVTGIDSSMSGNTTTGSGLVSNSATSPTAVQAATATDQSGSVVSTQAAVVDSSVETHEDAGDYTVDLNTATPITFDGTNINAGGADIQVNGSTVTIAAPGDYRLSGQLMDGQVIVNTSSKGNVRLILDGVTLTSSTSAPINIVDADKVILILVDGTQNTVTDAATYVYPSQDVDEPNAAIFSKADLSIAGSGALVVNANFNDGITSKDGLIIADGNITVIAADDGIRGKDYLVVEGGSLNVTAQGDGLKADNEVDAAMGYVLIENGAFNVNSGGDAISAATDVTINDGNFTLSSGGGSNAQLADTISAKAIKGTVSVNIVDGTFVLNSADDGVHSNGSILINAGSFTIATGDDGMHADGTLTINDGEFDIQTSYEGIEATDVIVNGGTMNIVASDDGINGAGGSDSSSTSLTNRSPKDNFNSSQGTITINGGTITIAAAGSGAGDGLDANGSITITGGDIIIKTPSSYRDYSSVDYNTTFSLTGGSVRTLDTNGTYAEVTESNVSNRGRGGH